MKITNVRAVQPVAPDAPPDWRTSLGQILVAVDTDRGLTGYGVGGGGLAGVHVVRTILRDALLGRDAEQVEALSLVMDRATLPVGRKGISVMAQSGVDLALWDLRGKAAGQPVGRLLGGTVGMPIPVYVTVWGDLPAELAGTHAGYKLHVEHHQRSGRIEAVAESVARAREILGRGPRLMIDAWMRWDLETALAVASAVAPFDVAWIEEPLPSDDPAGYAELVQRSPIPIAGGEHEFTADGFGELINRRLHHILQPDACWCGGMTHLVEIYRRARAANVRVCPHRGCEVWGLHAIAALDPEPLAESGRPWMTWVAGQPQVIDGTIQLADAPGFGVTIDEDELVVCGEP